MYWLDIKSYKLGYSKLSLVYGVVAELEAVMA